MASSFPSSSVSIAVLIIRCAVAISYFTLMLLFYMRAPPASNAEALGFVTQSRPLLQKALTHPPSLGPLGEMMVTMLGATDAPFTIFVPSRAAFINFLPLRRIIEEDEKVDPHDASSDIYAILSHVLSFSTVPKPIHTDSVPVKHEAVHESLSGFLLSLTRVPGRGLLVNNLTCVATDIDRGQVVIHIVDGVLLNAEFEQAFSFK